MLKKIYATTVLALICNWAFAQQQEVWTLEDAVSYALENNLTVQQAQLDMKQSEVDLYQAKMQRLPTLNANGQAGYNWGRSIDPTTNDFVNTEIKFASASLSANLTLFDGFAIQNSIKQSEVNTLAGREYVNSVRNNITLNVANQYLAVLFAKEQIKIAESQMETTSEQLERTKRLVNAGVVPASNQLEFEAQLAGNNRDLIQARNNLAIAKLNLKQLLQLPSSVEMEIEDPTLEIESLDVLEQTPQEIYSNAEQVLPQVRNADLQVESAEYAAKIARGGYYPTLSLGASLRSNYSSLGESRFLLGDPVPVTDTVGYLASNRDELVVVERLNVPRTTESGIGVWQQFDENFSQSAFVNLSIPVFNGFRNKVNVQRATINRDRAQLQATQTRQELRQNIETAFTDVVTAAESYQASRQQVESLEEAFRATEKQYNVGSLNFVDFQLATNNLFRARSELIRAKFEYVFKKKILEFYQGQPMSLRD